MHLERFAEPGERGFVFIRPKGGKLRRSKFHQNCVELRGFEPLTFCMPCINAA